MRNLFILLTFILSLSAFSYTAETNFYIGDVITLKVTEDIRIPAEKLEVRTSCGLLLQVAPKTRSRTFNKDREFKMKITSTTRFWTRAETTEGTTTIQKAFFQANSFEKFEALIKECSELQVLAIDAVEEEEAAK